VLSSGWLIVFPLPAEAPVILPAGNTVTVHVKVVKAVVLDNATFVEAPEHKVWDGGVATATGVGLTLMTTGMGSPGQPFADGVIE
jgi:hypothetical protein